MNPIIHAGLCKPPKKGLQANGTQFQLNGKRFRGIGVNHFSLFWRQIYSNLGPAVDYDADLKAIKQTWGLPFVRFAVGGYDRTSWLYWYNNRTAYLAMLANIVASAEKYGIGLVPVLLWDVRSFCDICYTTAATLQHPAHLADKTSVAWANFQLFISDVVGLLRTSSAVWAWDLTNELSSSCGPEYYSTWLLDGTGVDGGSTSLSWLNWNTRPDGTTYPASAKMSLAQSVTFTQEAVRYIQQTDGFGRIINSGNAAGFQAAVGCQTTNSLAADTLAKWNGDSSIRGMSWLAFRDQNFPTINMHIYPQSTSNSTFFSGAEKTQSELIVLSRQWADAVGKPFFLGEFGATRWKNTTEGVDQVSTDLASETTAFNAALSTVSANVDVSAVWNYRGDIASVVDTVPNWMRWDLTASQRQYQLTAIAAANAAMAI